MPACGCYHDFEMVSPEPGKVAVTLAPSGEIDLQRVLERAGLARTVHVENHIINSTVVLGGVQDHVKLTRILELLKSVMFVDLGPLIDECYALGPYSVSDENDQLERSSIGNLMYKAKYRNDAHALETLHESVQRFASAHPSLKNVGGVTAPPKSDPHTKDVAGHIVERIASRNRLPLIPVNKSRVTSPQKNLPESSDEQESTASVANSMIVEGSYTDLSALIIDDTIRYGGTMKEMARALRAAGASEVYGLSVCKDAKATRGRTSLSKERWS